LTWREWLERVMGLAAMVILAAGTTGESGTTLPVNAFDHPRDTLPFSDGWRFHRGDASGAEAPGFDDSTWRMLDVPHDWSIEDLPAAEDDGKGRSWQTGITARHGWPGLAEGGPSYAG